MGDIADAQEYYEQTHGARHRRTATPEWRLHAACAKLCYKRERSDRDFRFFSAGAEGQRSAARAAIAKMLGQNRRGLPDLWMMRRNPTAAVVVEFKSTSGKLSPEQSHWMAWLPFPVHVVRSIDAFVAILDAF